jgi:hypothetical protein
MRRHPSRFGRAAVTTLLLITSAAAAGAQTGSYHDLLRPELLGGVVLSMPDVRQTNDVGMQAATLLRERLASVFSVAGFDAVRVEAPYAMTATVAVPPTRDDGGGSTNGFERQISTVVDVYLQLTYRPTNEIMFEWTLQLPGTGRDRVDATENAIRLVRGNMTRYVELARDARLRILQHVESQCEALRQRTAALAKSGSFEGAIAQLLLVPDEARGCHAGAIEDATALLTERFGQQPDSVIARRLAPLKTTRDPIRAEWPLVHGARLAVEFVNANRRSQERAQSIW